MNIIAVNHCHLPEISPKVKQLCKKYGIPYKESTGYLEAFKKHWHHTRNMSASSSNRDDYLVEKVD